MNIVLSVNSEASLVNYELDSLPLCITAIQEILRINEINNDLPRNYNSKRGNVFPQICQEISH